MCKDGQVGEEQKQQRAWNSMVWKTTPWVTQRICYRRMKCCSTQRSTQCTWKAETAPSPASDFALCSAIKSTTSNRIGSLTFPMSDFSQTVCCCVLGKSHFLLSKIFWPLIIPQMTSFHMVHKQRNIILGFGGIIVLCKIRPLFLKPYL